MCASLLCQANKNIWPIKNWSDEGITENSNCLCFMQTDTRCCLSLSVQRFWFCIVQRQWWRMALKFQCQWPRSQKSKPERNCRIKRFHLFSSPEDLWRYAVVSATTILATDLLSPVCWEVGPPWISLVCPEHSRLRSGKF